MTNNFILKADSYKSSHWLQYPPNTTEVVSYISPRYSKDQLFPVTDGVVLFGVRAAYQNIIQKVITENDVIEAEAVLGANGTPFNRDGWLHLYNYTLNKGKMPLEIRCLQEGGVSPVGVVQLEIHNTEKAFYWLTSYVETSLLRYIWYGSTVATLSREIRNLIQGYMEKSCDTLDGLYWKLHDFGPRGATSSESAALGGMAHLLSFRGTDNLEAMSMAHKLYGSYVGKSIPAAEHSTMTAWGRSYESSAYANMVRQFGGIGKMYACVSDSYDIFNAVSNIWGDELKELVVNTGGTLVVRPDSGCPIKTPVKVIQLLMDKYGHTVNSKGYKVLPDCVRVIQGDGINYWSIRDICEEMMKEGLSIDNITFGMGGGLLQHVDRDTLGYAQKACSITINGREQSIGKDPVDGSKASLKGRRVVYSDVDGVLRNGDYGDDEILTNLLKPYNPDHNPFTPVHGV